MKARTYRFVDASRPGLLLGLSARRAAPIMGSALWLAFAQMINLPLPLALTGPAAGLVMTFGRYRGVPLSELALPATRMGARRVTGNGRWVRRSLLGAGPGQAEDVPKLLAGLTILEVEAPWATPVSGIAVVHDQRAATVSTVLAVEGHGFALAAPSDQDAMIEAWGAALSPLARERCPVKRITWHEWARAAGVADHGQFLDRCGVTSGIDELTDDYLALIDHQGRSTVTHETVLTVTVDLRRVRTRRTVDQLDAALEALDDETARLAARLTSIGLSVQPLSPTELTTATRLRSDPKRSAHLPALARSLAAATGRGSLEWGPMALRADWTHTRVDSSLHRSYRVASWPMLPVGADWLCPLLSESDANRTVTVVMEPVATRAAATAAEREVAMREADADERVQRGFHLKARDRKRLHAAQTREEELTEGHAEFRYVGLVTVTAPTEDDLDDSAAVIEQAAAESLVDLRGLDGRHDDGWLASLPLGRGVGPSSLF